MQNFHLIKRVAHLPVSVVVHAELERSVDMEVMRLCHNMCICGVRLRDFSHFEWQKLNIEQYISGSPFAAFCLKSSRFVKLIQYKSYLTTVVEALNSARKFHNCSRF